jgi:hypothetical protein
VEQREVADGEDGEGDCPTIRRRSPCPGHADERAGNSEPRGGEKRQPPGGRVVVDEQGGRQPRPGHEPQRDQQVEQPAPPIRELSVPPGVEPQPGQKGRRKGGEDERLHRIAQDPKGRKQEEHDVVDEEVTAERDEDGSRSQREPERPETTGLERDPSGGEGQRRNPQVERSQERLA